MTSVIRLVIAAFGIYLTLASSSISERLTENEKLLNSKNFAILWQSSNDCWYGINEEMTKFANDNFDINLILYGNKVMSDSLENKQKKFLNSQKYRILKESKPYEHTYWYNLTDIIESKFPDYDFSECVAIESDELAIKWSKKNPWFLVNEEMSDFAFAVHGKLIDSGIDPSKDSNIYYSEIDKQMRLRFPEYNWEN